MSPLRVQHADQEQWSEQRYYSKVQQLLMDAVLRLKSNSNNKHAVSAQHFADTTRTLTTMLQSNCTFHQEAASLAIERLAQATSAVMSANCIYGNKRKL